MEDNSFRNPKMMSFKYIFKADIETVWDVFMDHNLKIKKIFPDLICSIKFRKENRFDKIGSIFTYEFPDHVIIFECIDLSVESHYKIIKYKICSDTNESFYNHQMEHKLISDTNNGTTIFIWEIKFENPETLSMSPLKVEDYKKERLMVFKRYSEYFAEKEQEFSQYESIIIDASRQEVWEIVTNWSVLRTISPCVADEIEYVGDHLIEGSHLKLIYNTKINYDCDFLISKIDCKNDSEDWKYYMKLVHGYPKLPYQEIRFSIVFLASDKCFLYFDHYYKERLDVEMLNNVSKEKRNVLADIKRYLEK